MPTMGPPNPRQTFAPTYRTAARPGSIVAAALAAVLLMGSAPTAALAQRADMDQVMSRIQRLETEIQTLSREVYRGGGGRSAPAGAGGGVPSAVAGDFEVRLQRMESDMQQLTGKYEETAFAVSQLRDRLEKLAADIDFRLSRLEQGQGGGVPGAATGGAAAPSAPVAGGAAAPAAPAPAEARKPAGQETASLPSQLPTGSAQEQYDYAFNLIRVADYAGAEQAFAQFLKQHPKDALASNAQYWLAETLYVRGKFKEAAVAFAEGYQKFPKSQKAPDSLLKLAMSLGSVNAKDDACIALRTLETDYKDAPATIKRRADMEKSRLKCR